MFDAVSGRARDVEDREPVRDPREFLQWRPPVHRKEGPGSRCPQQVGAEDGRTVAGVHLVEADNLMPSVPRHCAAVRRTDVAHPVGALAEHRHQVALTLVVRDDDRKRDEAARPGWGVAVGGDGGGVRAGTNRADTRPTTHVRPRPEGRPPGAAAVPVGTGEPLADTDDDVRA